MKIGIVLGSIREGRFGDQVAAWVADQASARTDAEYELIDLMAFDVPLFTSATHPMAARKRYASAAVNAWSAAIDSCDGFVFVTAEYNHSIPGAFKNAVDSLGAEWLGKPVGFVSYGSIGGHRAVEAWRLSLANFSMPCLRAQVALAAGVDFGRGEPFVASERRINELDLMLDDLVKAIAAKG